MNANQGNTITAKRLSSSPVAAAPKAAGGVAIKRDHDQYILSVCNFLSKGWEVSLLGFLAFIIQQYELPVYMVGILSGAFIISQITISFFAGKIAHAIHSRNVIFLSIATSGCAWLTVSLSGSLASLYLAYILGGVSSGLFEPIGNSLVAKRCAPKNRGTAIGNFAAFGDLGRIAVVTVATGLAGFFGVNAACADVIPDAPSTRRLAACYS